MKLVVEESESANLSTALGAGRRTLVSSWLLQTELLRAIARHPADVAEEAVFEALASVELVDLERHDLMTAGSMPGRLRSLDAIHLAVAIRVGVDELITYDLELAAAATEVGLTVFSPGA